MKYVLHLEPAAALTRKDGLLDAVKMVGPFDTFDAARLWAVKANAVLDGLGVKTVFVGSLDEPSDFL